MTDLEVATLNNNSKLIMAQTMLKDITGSHSDRESLTIIHVLLKKLIYELYEEIEAFKIEDAPDEDSN